jgi:hydroxymethylpyrimidine pyrophosphatase-like HAD family hydrolase
LEETSLNYYDRYFTAYLPEMSLTSFVFDLDGTLSNDQIIISENDTSLFELFPNPSNFNTNLKFEEMGNYDIVVLNLNGKKIIEKSLEQVFEYSLDISSLNKGVYFVKVSNQNNIVSTKKLIKK